MCGDSLAEYHRFVRMARPWIAPEVAAWVKSYLQRNGVGVEVRPVARDARSITVLVSDIRKARALLSPLFPKGEEEPAGLVWVSPTKIADAVVFCRSKNALEFRRPTQRDRWTLRMTLVRLNLGRLSDFAIPIG